MNGVHDLGGMQGFGPIEPEANEPVFHADWEGAVLAMNIAAMTQRLYNVDEFRHGVERMGAARYLATSYYEHWLASIETLLVEKGVVSRAELEARTAAFFADPDLPLPRRSDPALVARMREAIRKGAAASSEERPSARFRPGDRVVTRNMHPPGHTRLPRYARGRRGAIERVHGVFTVPDSHAHGRGRQPQPLYSVAFESRELWGAAAAPRERVYLDLWEPYLEPDGGSGDGRQA
ncbi:MAG: nitrile hydratase subunit beta [Candidatus Rokubacteria bacterium]|nr:nitrile hydratase subunit beta [Candidatus Rokubacteria bacterium]